MLGVTEDDLPARLNLALKALSLSRGRLATELAVDKSVISRWLNGRQAPSGQNLANITALIASYRPGFNLLDWEGNPEAFAAKLGVGGSAARHFPDHLPFGGLPENVLREAHNITELRGEAYEGFWRTTRVAIGQPGRFIHNHLMIRRNAAGALTFKLGVEDMRFEGVSFPTQTQLFSIGADARTGIFVFTILNAVLRHRAEVMDGLALTCQRIGGGTPAALAILMERCGDLSGDPDADAATFEATVGNDTLAPDGSISDQIRDHLFRDIGPAALAAGGAALLMMPFATSMSRGPLSATR